MNAFRTTFEIPDQGIRFDHKNEVFSIGSCFAENIAEKLEHYMFRVASNPNGIVFNPISLASNLLHLLENSNYQAQDLIEREGLWFCWEHHHMIFDINQTQLLSKINASSKVASKKLFKSKTLLLTFGTAFAYRNIKTAKIVANCHKLPGNEFEKVRLSQHQIVGNWQDVLDVLFEKLPDMNVIITVSPVRHIKDGVVANQRSKAILHGALELLCTQYSRVHYFPSYEIMMDDLRDYRFYESDMIHPNKVAIEYIWDRFVKTYMTAETLSLMKKIDHLQQRSAHRSLHPSSKANLVFQEKLKKDWKQFYLEYPFLTVKGDS